jgi:hypothetical protein
MTNLTTTETEQLRQIETRIKSIAMRMVFDIGGQLIEARSILSTKAFSDWVQTSVGIKPRQAHRYMAATKRFSAVHLGAQLPASVLMDLAPQSVPDEAVQQVVNLVNDGQQVSRRQAKEIIRRHQAVDQPDVIDADSEQPVENTPLPSEQRTPDQIVRDLLVELQDRPDDLAAVTSQLTEAYPTAASLDESTQGVLAERVYADHLHAISDSDLVEVLEHIAAKRDIRPASKKEREQGMLFAFDPMSVIPRGKLDCPEFIEAWGQWCKYNELIGKPLIRIVAEAQISRLRRRSVERVCTAINDAIANRMLRIPEGKEVSSDFIPPTAEEVAAFIRERQIAGVDPVEFVRHYTISGWRLKGGNPMRDWHAAVLKWQAWQRENAPKRSFYEMHSRRLN